MSYEPIVGQWYNVVCPVCYSTVNFECSSLQRYAVPCSCKALVNLRNPDVELMAEDSGKYPSDSDQTVRYSKDVDMSSGLSACVQVGIIITDLEEEKSKTMPAHMGGETRHAFSMQRNQALAEKFSFLYPITYTLEYLVFGTRPVAKIGHLRIFRKHLPFYGQVNISVPKTSPSSATPSFITFTLMIGFMWFVHHLDQGWSNGLRWVQYVLIFSFYTLMYSLVYDDPGFIRPGYVDNEGGLGGELTLKDIETNQRESRWESVNGVPMESKWCSTCEMYRPPRAAHCYLCGLCCYDHDHHCSVIGVCVGRRRLERFAAFVTVTSIGLIIPTFTVIWGLYYHSEQFTQGEVHISLVLLVFLLLFGIPITLTAISMWQSVVFEASTRERIHGVYMNKRNPYDMGFFRNIYYHLWRRRVAPSLFSDTFVDLCAMRYQKRELGQGKTTTCF